MRFRVNGGEIVFDDGGMNLLSLEALRELRDVIDRVIPSAEEREESRTDGAISAQSAGDSSPSSRLGMTLLTFRFARSAGADMNQMVRFSARDAELFSREGQELFAAIGKLRMLTVALIDGDCFGGALDLAMSFDLRFATPRSRFSHPGARLGIVTGFGGTSRWRAITGRASANALMLANRALSAEEAMRIGLVDRVADDHAGELRRLEQLDSATTQLVKTLANHAEKLTKSQMLLLAERLGALYTR